MLLALVAPLLVARMASATCHSSLPSNIDAGPFAHYGNAITHLRMLGLKPPSS